LTAIIKENEGLTQVMLRAVSDKSHGLNGFMNEITADLRHVVNTVQSAHEIGVIRKEQVINIIDSVVQRSSFGGGEGAASVNIKDSVVQRTEFKGDGKNTFEKEHLGSQDTNFVDSERSTSSTSAPSQSEDTLSTYHASSQTKKERVKTKNETKSRYIKSTVLAFGLITLIILIGTVVYITNPQDSIFPVVPTATPTPTSSPTITPAPKPATFDKPATQEVSSNLMVKNIEGIRAMDSSGDKSPTIDLLIIKVGLNVGSVPVDINQLVISITDGTTTNNLIYAANDKTYGNAMTGYSASNTAGQNVVAMFTQGDIQKFFTVEKIRDEDASFSQSNPIMNTGDLITIYVATTSDHASSSGYQYIGDSYIGGLKTSHLNLLPRTTVNIVLTPEAGTATTADFITPSSYGVKETVQLYP